MPATAHHQAVHRDITERMASARDRRVAIQCLAALATGGSLCAVPPPPTEAQIQAFIAAMHRNPHIVPSFDPDDP